jgi:hypothetical protein
MIISVSTKVEPLKSKYNFLKDKKLNVVASFSVQSPLVIVISNKQEVDEPELIQKIYQGDLELPGKVHKQMLSFYSVM